MNNSNHISAYAMVSELTSALPKRSREVIVSRFGLKDGKKKTLEAIGNGFGITRERVRQIEADGLEALRKPEAMGRIAGQSEAVKAYFAEHGGLRREERLLEELAARFGGNTPQERAAATLIMTLVGSYERRREDDDFYTLWYAASEKVSKARRAIELLSQTFTQERRTILDDELQDRASKVAAGMGDATSVAVLAYVDASKAVELNPFGEWGLARWAEVKPRGVKDKAYLIFKRETKPLHFREVAEKINETIAKKRPAHPQTVHNELIKDKRFVLVGRGTYALAEWGYQPGTVREVLLAVLRENGRPMTKDELLAEVLKRRFVKENTVLLNLQHRSFFVRTGEGKYAVKAA